MQKFSILKVLMNDGLKREFLSLLLLGNFKIKAETAITSETRELLNFHWKQTEALSTAVCFQFSALIFRSTLKKALKNRELN